MRYKVKISMGIDVEAKDEECVRIVMRENVPHLDMCGAGIGMGGYSAKTNDEEIEILSIVRA